MPLTLTAGDIMKQLTQLTIEQYNEHMRRGEGRLPVDVVENTLIDELPFGAWFICEGLRYMRVDSFYYDAVSEYGRCRLFDYGTKCKPIGVIVRETYKVDKIKLVELHKDKPPKEIVAATGLRLQQVWYYLRKLNVKKRKIDFLPSAEELRADGLSQVALAAKYGVSKLTIAKRLKDEAKSQQ